MKLRRKNRHILKDRLYLNMDYLSVGELVDIKSSLTFDNPVYAKVKKFSHYSRTNVPPHISYYSSCGNNYLAVPVGYNVPKSVRVDSFTTEDCRVCPSVEYPPFVLTLRDDQQESAESYLVSNVNPWKLNGMVQMPTGKGKSILGIYLAQKLSVKTLIVVHKDDLISGWKKDIDLCFNFKLFPGLIKAQKRHIGEQITLATIQTLSRLSEEELSSLYGEFGLIICDEGHHTPSNTYDLLNRFYPRFRLCLTATPERADGLTHVMQLYFGGFAYKFNNVAGEDDPDILPVSVYIRNVPTYCDPLYRTKRGKWELHQLAFPFSARPDFNKGFSRYSDIPYKEKPQLPYQVLDNFAVTDEHTVDMVISDILREYNKGLSCVVFFTQKEHLRLYREYLISKGVPENNIGLYYGDASNKDNDEVREKAESNRQFITLTTYAKASEGTNVKQWEVAFLVSSVNNGKTVEQVIGRIRRRKDGEKQNFAAVYDYGYAHCVILSNHIFQRKSRYKKLGFHISNSTGFSRKFTRGYQR